jgi:hypothetical protein
MQVRAFSTKMLQGVSGPEVFVMLEMANDAAQ